MTKRALPTIERLSVRGQDVLLIGFELPRGPTTLTPAEREVASLLVLGKRNREIAEARGTTVRTINKQVESLYVKLGVRSRSQLALVMNVVDSGRTQHGAARDVEGALAAAARRTRSREAAVHGGDPPLEAQRAGTAERRR